MTAEPATLEEVAVLARAAGLELAPDYFAELVAAYRGIQPMLVRARQAVVRTDEPANLFDPRKFMPRAG